MSVVIPLAEKFTDIARWRLRGLREAANATFFNLL